MVVYKAFIQGWYQYINQQAAISFTLINEPVWSHCSFSIQGQQNSVGSTRIAIRRGAACRRAKIPMVSRINGTGTCF